MGKKRTGRPAKPPEKAKGRYLQVRVQQAEKEAFDAAADLAGIDLSAWVRERLRLAARTELAQADKNVPFMS